MNRKLIVAEPPESQREVAERPERDLIFKRLLLGELKSALKISLVIFN